MRIQDLDPLARLQCLADGLSWRVGPFSVRVSTSLLDVSDQLGFLYGEFDLLEPDYLVDAELGAWSIGWGSKRASIYSDGQVVFGHLLRSHVVPLLEWAMNVIVFHGHSLHLLVHAAVVEKGGRALILPGDAGAGKSTLCAALIHRGWRLLSDEVAVIRRSDGMILPAPRPVSLKEESIELIRSVATDATLGPIWHGTAKGAVAHLRAPSDSIRRMHEVALPSWLVFPHFERGVPTVLKRYSKARAMPHFAEQAFNYNNFGVEGFRLLTELVDASDCYKLHFGDLETALALLEELVPLSSPLQLTNRGNQ